MIYLIIILLVGWFVYELLTAPEGYEDKGGFHYGKK